MSWIIDGIVILIFVVTALMGFYKGFIKYLIVMAGTIAAVIISYAASGFLSEPVYDRYFKETVTDNIESTISQVDVISAAQDGLAKAGVPYEISREDIKGILQKGGDIAENVDEYLKQNGADSQTANDISENVDDYLHTDLKKEIHNSNSGTFSNKYKLIADNIDEIISVLASDDKAQSAAYLEKNIFAEPIVGIVRVVLFAICFIVISLLIKLILKISGVFNKLPALNAANRFGGLLLGLCKGALYVALIAFLYCTVINAANGSIDIITAENAEKTYLFKYFFNFFYK